MFGRASDDEQVSIAAGMARFWRYCEELADDRRARPRDDFTSDLVHTPDETGEPLSQQEVATILFGLLLAGHETTTNLLGNGLRRFLEQRERWETLCAEPALIPNAVEEVLRYDSSVIHWRRRTTDRGRAERRHRARRRRRAHRHRRRQPGPGGVRRPRRLRPSTAQRPRSPLVRLRPPRLPRRAACAARSEGRVRGADQPPARAAPCRRPATSSSCRSSPSAAPPRCGSRPDDVLAIDRSAKAIADPGSRRRRSFFGRSGATDDIVLSEELVDHEWARRGVHRSAG